jgi:MinD superfamily P-loop ATPase
MKQLLILSGKGGTGKTTVASAFIDLNQTKQFADCDVEAPNLHLLYKQGKKTSQDYHGLAKAKIDPDQCIQCGACLEHCRFNAIEYIDTYQVNPYKCEGCGVCGYVCPAGAIEFESLVDGYIETYEQDYFFSTGSLKMGSGNSGLLVSEVKKQLNRDDQALTIIDGPPGIGCPVIASMSGVDFILLVTEPSMSGFSDMKRMIQTIKRTKIPMAVCINKYDINEKITQQIIDYLLVEAIPYLGQIQYDRDVNVWINHGRNIMESNHEVAHQIKKIYDRVQDLL